MTHTDWNLEKIFADDAARVAKKTEIEEKLAHLAQMAPGSPDTLYDILEASSALTLALETYATYTFMKRDTASKDPDNQAMALEAEALVAKVSAQTAFIRPFILQIPEEVLQQKLKEERFAPYRLPIERIRRYAAHTLSASEEEILSSVQESGSLFQNAFYMLSYADMTFPPLEDGTALTQASYISLLESPDREKRKDAFYKYYGVYDGLKNTLSSTLYGSTLNDVRISQLRKFESARHASLFEDDVDVKVYDALIEAVHAALPSLHEYYRAKGAAQDLVPLHMYDVYLPYETKETDPIPYETGQQWLLDAVEILGEDYVQIVQEAYGNRWIDVYPKDGKQSGAYSGGSYVTDPYILLNYMENLDSVFTLAHEMGHSAHSYLSRKNNSYEEHGYTIFAAEVASTFNELLLLHYLMEKAETKEEKLPLLNHLLNSYKSTVFRQTMFAEFELETHRRVEAGESLTADALSSLYLSLNEKYFGDSVVSDPEIALEYLRIPHFYRAFYVYKYATGFISSALLSKRVIEGVPGAKELYLEFLKDGCKHFPLEQLKAAGVDLTDPEVLKEGFEIFADAVKEFEELV